MKRSVLVASGVAIAVVLVSASMIVWHYRQLRFRYSQGPYAHAIGARYDTTSLAVLVGTQVLLGGAPIMDRGRIRWQLLHVRPTNVASGLKVVATTGMRVPPALGIGPMQWVRHTAHQPIRQLPMGTLTTDAEPELVVDVTKPGRYIINQLQSYTTTRMRPSSSLAKMRRRVPPQTGQHPVDVVGPSSKFAICRWYWH